MTKVAVAVFVYPGVDIFLEDLFFSLNKQTVKAFDLVIFNDGLSKEKLEPLVLKFTNVFPVKIIPLSGSIAKIRQQGLAFLKSESYNFVIWVDGDDFIDDNRVELVLEKLYLYDIVINDLHIVGSNGELNERNYLSNRLKSGQEITYLDIENRNFMGFSNSAINLKKLSHTIEIPDNIVAVDWYMNYFLLNKGFSAIFINETATSYRQHPSNTVGIQKFSEVEIIKGIGVKYKHYAALVNYAPRLKNLLGYYYNLLENPEILDNKIHKLLALKNEGHLPDKPLWWESF